MPSATLNRIVMDSVHGICDLDERVRKIVDTPEIQRLRLIRQTGLAYLVYPGLEHSRFAHVIGVYGIARRVFQHLRSQAEDFGASVPSHFAELEAPFLTAALCHDIGHTAFSHALEPVLLPDDVSNHEDCTLRLLEESDRDLPKRIGDLCDLAEVAQLLRGDHWVDGLSKLLSGPIDVDRSDYLLRDTRGAGLVYGLHDLDWMIRSVFLWPDSTDRHRLVFDWGRGLVALRHFLAARRSMYMQVYWHRTVRGAEQMIRAMFERAIDIGSGLEAADLIPFGLRALLREGRRPTLEEFLATDDVAVWTVINHWARSSSDAVLNYLSRQFVRRRLPKQVRSWPGVVPDDARSVVRNAVREALQRQTIPDLPRLEGAHLEEALDYFVLSDRCEFKEDIGLEGLLFDTGEEAPLGLSGLPESPDREIGNGSNDFSIARLYVPEDVLGAVQAALERRAA